MGRPGSASNSSKRKWRRISTRPRQKRKMEPGCNSSIPSNIVPTSGTKLKVKYSGNAPVSYTHLDVYKRQEYVYLQGKRVLADQMDFLRAHFPRSSPLHQRLARLS